MKQIIYIIIFLLVPLCLSAQSSSQNYILTRVYQTADSTKYLDKIQYFDGLGRPVETIQKAQSSKDGTTWVDLVNLTEYDGFGREYKHWLPTPTSGNTGAYVAPTDFVGLANSEYGSSEKPYATTDFEASPVSRVTGKYGAGASWYAAKKNDSILYQTNAGEVVYFFVNSSNKLQRTGYYAANTLYKTITTDEDGKASAEYKDKQGQVVMKHSSSNADTYYVYDDLGQLCYVLPPRAVDGLPNDGTFDDNIWMALEQFAYLYKYDERGNNVMKRLPGCDSICMVYDKADRLVLSQDGNQRAKTVKQWTVTKYDVFGRVIYTGLLNSALNRVQYKAILDNQVITETYDPTSTFYNTGYTCQNTLTGIIPLTVNYYDDYRFLRMLSPSDSTNLKYTTLAGYDGQFGNAKGLLTGTRAYLLDSTINRYLTTAMYYDDRGRVVQTRSTNHMGGYNYAYNHYDFTGRVLNTYKIQNGASNTAIPESYTYTYDQAGRLLTTTYQIKNRTSVLLSSLTYDELGRLKTNKRHNQTDVESYVYNIRNWTDTIKSGTFEEDLFYNSNLPTGATPCYNGNISYSTWTYNGVVKGYQYTYDDLNRLTNAYFKKGTSSSSDNDFSENFVYDKMGNITSLQRSMSGHYIDNLTLTYSGNQLSRVGDDAGSQNLYAVKEYPATTNATSGPSMTYDKNGNLVYDYDRKIATIRYNILNLPDTIQFTTGNQIINRYAADGRKLKTDYYTYVVPLSVPLDPGKVITNPAYVANVVNLSGTSYVDDAEYTRRSDGLTYANGGKVYNSEGYTIGDGLTTYSYYRKDHLGNNREVWCPNNIGTGNIAQRTQYYPSGLPWSEGLNPSSQERKYNGKEFIEMDGYDTYDYGARGLQAATMRFMTVDPHAENYYSISPYAYCAGNPIKFIDPDGQDYGLTFDDKTKTVTVSATYYTTSSSLTSANQSATTLNNQSGDYKYTVGSGNTATTYTVNFDMKVVEVKVDPNMGEMGSLNIALSSDNSGQGNIFRVVPDSKMDPNTNGETSGGNYVQVKDSKSNSDTGAHEMGHTLGLDHNTSGLMTPASTDPNRSSNVNKSDVKDIISYPLKGKVNYENDSNGNRTDAGKGTVINNTNYTNDQLKKGQVK